MTLKSGGFAFVLVTTGLASAEPMRPRLYFERNVGQAPAETRFITRTDDTSVQILDRGLVIHRRRMAEPVRLDWIGSRGVKSWTALDSTGGVSNYYTEHLRAAGVEHFGAVRGRELYRGIDVRFHGNERQLEFDFELAPHADARQIRWRARRGSRGCEWRSCRERRIPVAPSDAEYEGWQFQRSSLLSRIIDPVLLANNFLISAEFAARNGALSDADFIRLLYRQILLREPAPDEVDDHLQSIGIGPPRKVQDVLNSPEFQAGAGPRLSSFLLSATLLMRSPTGLEHYTRINQLENGAAFTAVLQAILDSPKFASVLN